AQNNLGHLILNLESWLLVIYIKIFKPIGREGIAKVNGSCVLRKVPRDVCVVELDVKTFGENGRGPRTPVKIPHKVLHKLTTIVVTGVDGHLDTISVKESDEFIKSSVENLVPNPSESEDERECDVPACDDFTAFSNLLFDADDDFSSSNNESFSDEDISKEIYSNPLFDKEIIFIKIDPHHLNDEPDLIESMLNQDSLIISSSKIDYLLDELAGELILLKSIPLGINEVDCDPEEEIHLIEKLLYDNSSPRPPKEFISENSDATIESFSPSPILVEDIDSLRDVIDLSLTLDDSMPPGIGDDDYNSKGVILILEELLSNDSLSLPENESVHFDIPSSCRPPTKPPDDDEIEPNSGILTVKVLSSESPMMIYGGTFLSWMFHFSISILFDQLKYGGIWNSRILKTCAEGFVLQSSLLQLQLESNIQI
nr:hypothetical protein [Tanacetum cinerariifolium]